MTDTDWVKPGATCWVLRDRGRSGMGLPGSELDLERVTIEKVGKRDVVVLDERNGEQRFNLHKGLVREEGDSWSRVKYALLAQDDPRVKEARAMIAEARARQRIRKTIDAMHRMDWSAEDWEAKVREGLNRLSALMDVRSQGSP